MANIVIYTKANCAYCTWAMQFLDAKHLPYEEIRIDLHPEKYDEMKQLSGKHTTPQIIINQQAIGGYDDLTALAQAGKLEELLK